jgi:O-antigen ligase
VRPAARTAAVRDEVPSIDTLFFGLAVVITGGLAVTFGPLVIASAAELAGSVGLVLIAGIAVVAVLLHVESILHLLVGSMFAESIAVGNVRVGRLLAVVAISTVIGRFALTAWRPPRIPLHLWVPIGAFTAWVWASGFWAESAGGWAGAVGRLGLGLCYLVAFATFVHDSRQLRQLLRTFVLGATVAAAIGINQALEGSRAIGLQGDANLYAVYQVAAVPAAVALVLTSRHWTRWVWVATAVPLLGSVIASSSRGGLLATVIMLCLLVARGMLSSLLGLSRLAVGALLAIALLIGGSLLLANNDRLAVDKVREDRASGRLEIWRVAWRETRRHPVLGLGGGNFQKRSSQLLATEPGVLLDKNAEIIKGGSIMVHNVYLETAVEYGFIGASFWLGVLWTCAAAARQILARARNAPLLEALLAMYVAFLAAAFFLSVVNSKLLWMLAGTIIAVHARSAGLSDSDAATRWGTS